MTDITLLDGSIGQEIVHRSGDRPTPLWSTAVMIENPGIVADVHRAYFDAGATVATTNTYAVHVDRLDRVGMADSHGKLLDAAMDQAVAARDAHGSGRIALSLGPLGATYRPDIQVPLSEAAAAFAVIVGRLGSRADVILPETVSSLHDARGVMMGCAAGDTPVWLAVTVDDDDSTRLRSGENLSDLARIVTEFDPAALLINCSRPEAIGPALNIIKTMGKPFGAYANGFTNIAAGFLEEAPTVDALTARTDLGPEQYARFAMQWIDHGATIIGGCCEAGPDHIAELARQLRANNHTIV